MEYAPIAKKKKRKQLFGKLTSSYNLKFQWKNKK